MDTLANADFSTILAWFLAAGLVVSLVLLARVYSARKKERIHRDQEFTRLRNDLNQAHRMEAVGVLAGGIVHNLNNLLAVIIGHTQMASHSLSADHPIKGELDRIRKAGDMAKDLVSEVSDYYRQADQARKPTDLLLVIRDTVKLLRDILPATVELRTDLKPCGPVLATSTGVQQVLMNLCSNSVHAMFRNRGLIEITLAEEDVEDWREGIPQDLRPGSYVKLTVRDNGRGMDQHTLKRIFDSYFTSVDNGSKMGIGLSTVRSILQSHEGISIPQSQVGKGTSFEIYFPLIAWSVDTKPEIPSEPVQAVGSSPTGVEGELAAAVPQIPGRKAAGESKGNVLLVDDEEMVAQVMARGLRNLGFQVAMYTDCLEAMASFSRSPFSFDVVVTDQIMPHMSGVRFTKKIHELNPKIPVILFTGFRDSFNEKQAREAGVSEFILKPGSYLDLADLINRLLLRRKEGKA